MLVEPVGAITATPTAHLLAHCPQYLTPVWPVETVTAVLTTHLLISHNLTHPTRSSCHALPLLSAYHAFAQVGMVLEPRNKAACEASSLPSSKGVKISEV